MQSSDRPTVPGAWWKSSENYRSFNQKKTLHKGCTTKTETETETGRGNETSPQQRHQRHGTAGSRVQARVMDGTHEA